MDKVYKVYLTEKQIDAILQALFVCEVELGKGRYTSEVRNILLNRRGGKGKIKEATLQKRGDIKC